jgi:uncharacterized membrane protein YcaP (DUF421 family)
MLQITWHGVLEVIARTATIYLVVLIGVRLSGKREVGQMTPFDLTLLLLISNAVQNSMVGQDSSLLGGILAAVTLLVMNYLVAELSGANRKFRKFVQGSPALLIHSGQIIPAHMAREHVTMDEIQRALREHGIGSVQEISLGVLEVDGSISLLKYEDVPNVAANHRRMRFLQRHQ